MSSAQSRLLLAAVVWMMAWVPALSKAEKARKLRGVLTDNQVIESEKLGYRLQYRAYLPAGHAGLEDLPSIYVTDGQWYLAQGEMVRLLDRMIRRGRIDPLVAIFIDNRDPDELSVNRRNQQFFCNQNYADFVSEELVPGIDARYRTRARREDRVILGLSFGGLNAACFAFQAPASFGGIAMQSPALHPVHGIYEAFRRNPRLSLRVFLSTGVENDNVSSTRRLKNILKDKDYDLRYVEVEAGHDWRNWKPLLDDILLFFFDPERSR